MSASRPQSSSGRTERDTVDHDGGVYPAIQPHPASSVVLRWAAVCLPLRFLVSRVFLFKRNRRPQSNRSRSLSLCIKSQQPLAKPPRVKELFLRVSQKSTKEARDGRPSLLNKRYRLDSYHVETFSAADVLAPHGVIAPHHIALCLSKTRAIAIVGSARQLRFFSSNDPFNLILSLLPAVRTGHHMRTLLLPLIKKIAFFHTAPRGLVPGLIPGYAPSAILPDITPRRQE
jgi:hypothetical protein